MCTNNGIYREIENENKQQAKRHKVPAFSTCVCVSNIDSSLFLLSPNVYHVEGTYSSVYRECLFNLLLVGFSRTHNSLTFSTHEREKNFSECANRISPIFLRKSVSLVLFPRKLTYECVHYLRQFTSIAIM